MHNCMQISECFAKKNWDIVHLSTSTYANRHIHSMKRSSNVDCLYILY